MYSLLIIDDNKVLLNSLTMYLKTEGFNVEGVVTAVEGLVKIKEKKWDLVLLDYYLGDMDAATFLNLISDFKDKPKIVVFTAQPSEEIEHDILKSNVVDYIRKTENPEILSTRVKRILEGNHNIVSKLVSEQENLEVNIEYRNVIKDGEEIILTNTEFELLRLFLENKNRVLSREKIYSSLWASKKKYLDELRTIDVHVLNLRKKVKVECIQNRKGVGYVWDER